MPTRWHNHKEVAERKGTRTHRDRLFQKWPRHQKRPPLLVVGDLEEEEEELPGSWFSSISLRHAICIE